MLGIVGESGSGKTTLLKSISSRLTPQSGEILYQNRSLYGMNEADRRRLLRTEWGVVHQHPLDGLRRQVSAGGNIGERLMKYWRASLRRHPRHRAALAGGGGDPCLAYRRPANHLFRRYAAAPADRPQPRHPSQTGVYGRTHRWAGRFCTGQTAGPAARLVVELDLAVVIVTHDLGVARLLADRLLVMKQGQVVESGLTDRVLDDPHHPYTQLLVSSVLQN